jgi:2-keto-4-pentenoate hydratase/2-oxohepta-3-ene-1,7-dioic acid hydratase in catechol pathway
MKLVTFSTAGGAPRTGLLAGDESVIEIGASAAAAGVALPFDPASMLSLIGAGPPALAALRAVCAADRPARVAATQARLHAPIPRPVKNLFCVGWNYLDHFNEGAAHRKAPVDLPEHPAFFSKAATAINGPFDPIPWSAAVTEQLDWECELAVVIGTGGRNIAEADAMRHVFGHMAANDVTGRDMQRYHGNQWFKGKSLDGSCPTGPCIVTADALDPADLALSTRVNGVIKQQSSTRHLYFRIPRIIAELSLGLTLEPGDIILTGTPQGVGYARTPPEFLRPGDLLETEVAGIGVLRNPIVAA